MGNNDALENEDQIDIFSRWVQALDAGARGEPYWLDLDPDLLKERAQGAPTEELERRLQALAEAFRQTRQRLLKDRESPSTLREVYNPELDIFITERFYRIRIAMLVRRRRRELGHTLAEVGSRLGGLSASYVSQIEQARTLPTPERAAALDNFLQILATTGQSVAQLLLESREALAEAGQQGEALAGRSAGTSVSSWRLPDAPAVELIHPQVASAVAGWEGPIGRREVDLIQAIATRPDFRLALIRLNSLPRELQDSLLELTSAIRRHAVRDGRPMTRVLPPYDPHGIWKRQRAADQPLARWELPTLLLELVEAFSPSELMVDDPAGTLTRATAELTARGFAAEGIIRGPVLRRAASRSVDAWRFLEKGLMPRRARSLGAARSWLAEQAETLPPPTLARILWSYWASLDLEEVLNQPSPPKDFPAATPAYDDMTAWLFDRSTQPNLRVWDRRSLQVEWRLNSTPERLSEPFAQASILWQPVADDVQNELARRRRREVSARQTEVPPEVRGYELSAMGNAAFRRGEIAAAEHIFRAVVEQFPTVPDGPNNLGFVLLANGDAGGALECFKKADEMGYTRHLVLVNSGCAEYTANNFERALDRFEAALQQVSFEASLLFLIHDQRLVQVNLEGGADFAALCGINAAWSAFRLGRIQAAHGLLQAARSSPEQIAPERLSVLEASAAELDERLHQPTD
jgi:transcriptional regulator with XRE-family HTH domain/tetratricopeptide (TPR) repeat protein